ncbi:hypothetical protein FDF74_09955 [Clostridium niameyense]|uniref:Uncharacterized protein n=1 Tax=Clostridium niameyense TaxID=1622073 RepID=A0A6M0RB45_9CLOT|nr:hypothetical protein [Clostridium niameyense]NEZ47514.1 hypothetical protein [Clostridium niameyense]
MYKICKVIKVTGEILGEEIENGTIITGNMLGKIAEKNKHERLANVFRKGSKVLGKGSSITAKVIFSTTSNFLNKSIKVSKLTTKFLEKNAVKTEVKIYGDSKEFYKNKCIDAEYKIIE